MEWEVGQLPTDPLLYRNYFPEELQWIYFEQRFQRFEYESKLAEEECEVNNNYSLLYNDWDMFWCFRDYEVKTAAEDDCLEHVGNGKCKGRKILRAEELEFEEVQKYFDRPISEAAKELKMGLTLLKKRCRELGIRRWPHRQLRSLNSLIHNLKEMGLEKEVSMMEEQRRMLQKQPQMVLNERAKKIRQKSFKANYHRRRRRSKNMPTN